MLSPSVLKVPVKRCAKSRGLKSGDSRVSVHTRLSKLIAYRRVTPRES